MAPGSPLHPDWVWQGSEQTAKAGRGWPCPCRGERQAGLEPGCRDLGASSGRAPRGWLTPAGLRDTGTEKPAAPAEATFSHKWEPVRVPQGKDLGAHNRSTHSFLPPAVGEGPQTPNPLGPVPWNACTVLKNHTGPTESHTPSHDRPHAATRNHT